MFSPFIPTMTSSDLISANLRDPLHPNVMLGFFVVYGPATASPQID